MPALQHASVMPLFGDTARLACRRRRESAIDAGFLPTQPQSQEGATVARTTGVVAAPNLATAIGLLLARSALSQMDVPTRTSYVMAVVTPEERPAAASLTAVPRSFAAALSPLLAGYLLTLSIFGWPLIIGGALKAIYDVLLLFKFQKLRPPEEAGASMG
jgi:MFS family permease